MYLNEQIRADLAASILEAKGQLFELNSSRQELINNTKQAESKYSGAVTSSLSFAPATEASPIDEAVFIAERIEAFDPSSRRIDNYNEELRMLVGLASSAKDSAKLEEL